MAVLPLRYHPDPVLRQKAKRLGIIDGSIRRLVEDMLETMHHADGVGLAAPQVGVSLRVAVIQLPEEEQPLVLINPEVVKKKGERDVAEACLSVPGYQGQLKRSLQVVVKALNREGKSFRVKGEELLAQALEHEIDHLNGVLYIDRLESPEMLKKIVEGEVGEETHAQ
jgi:peptide deformylase